MRESLSHAFFGHSVQPVEVLFTGNDTWVIFGEILGDSVGFGEL